MSTACRSFNKELAEGAAPFPSGKLKGRTVVRIDRALTVAEAGPWHAAFTAQLRDAESLFLDLTAMTAADAIGLQLLCAARRSALAAGMEFSVAGAPEAFFAACEAAGLAPEELGVSASK